MFKHRLEPILTLILLFLHNNIHRHSTHTTLSKLYCDDRNSEHKETVSVTKTK